STDFVFGEGGPYDETVTPAPLNFYGQSKLIAEQLVLASNLQVAIVRPVFIYGKVLAGMPPTFLHWVKTNLDNKKPMKIVNDQQRTPTFVKDICEGIFLMILKKVTGIFHLAGKDVLTPYTMATKLANLLYLDDTLIEPVMSATFAEPVQRAKKSGLKIDKAIKILGYNPVSFEEGVRLSFLNK
ncbi:MAG: sugar nucleotide-binding protein, partial [Deinococcales bacterium]|nr:sugar nucleotide-binding protein [Chitinophagaceae bacterium]